MYIDRTLVIGAGGTGGQLIPSLARLLTYHPNANSTTFIADGDSFEDHNQERQICGPAQVGRNKAEVMAEFCRDIGLTSVCSVPRFINHDAIRQVLGDACFPLVVSTVDNDATRAAIISVLEERTGDWLHVTTGNADNSDGQFRISTSTHWHGVINGQPVGLNPALLFDNIAHPQDTIPSQGSCALQAPSAPQLISANALSSVMALLVIQNVLDDRLDFTANSAFANGRTFKLTIS